MAKDVSRAGDTNADGTFDDADIALLMDMIQSKMSRNAAADCNGDGEINVQDMACVNNKRGQTGFDRVLFVYDEAGRLIGEYLKNGASFTTLKEYIWLGDLPVAVIENDTLYHVYADHLNTPRAITTADGTLVWSWHSDAYGYVPPEQDADGDGVLFTYNLRFPGQYYDIETGLFYNWHRNYDPMTGRYLEADPIGLDGGLNLYGYVGGNPLTQMDPKGLESFAACVDTFFWDGMGDTSICSYYDEQSALNPSCNYYRKAGGICRGESRQVNFLVNAAMWFSDRLPVRRQSAVFDSIRSKLIFYDMQARKMGKVDADGCVLGDTNEFYHLTAFEGSGISMYAFGGLYWPQNRSWLWYDAYDGGMGNPIPYDDRGNDPLDDMTNRGFRIIQESTQ